jgi:hypothetical protein
MTNFDMTPIDNPDSHSLTLRGRVTSAERDAFSDAKAADDARHQAILDLRGADQRLAERQRELGQRQNALAEAERALHPNHETLERHDELVLAATQAVAAATGERNRLTGVLAAATRRENQADAALAAAKRMGDIARQA